MGSKDFEDGVCSVDDPASLKAFLKAMREGSKKDYRVGNTTTDEVSEVASPVRVPTPDMEATNDDGDGIGTIPAEVVPKTNGVKILEKSDLMTFSTGDAIGTIPAKSAVKTNEVEAAEMSDLMAFSTIGEPEHASKESDGKGETVRAGLKFATMADEKIFKQYDLQEASIDKTEDDLESQDAHKTNLVNGDGGMKETDAWTMETKASTFKPEAKPFHPASNFNPEATSFDHVDPLAGSVDIDDPRAKKAFLAAVRSKGNALPSTYTPGAFRGIDKSASVETIVTEAPVPEPATPEVPTVKATSIFASPPSNTTRHNRDGNTVVNKQLDSPHLTGVVAPASTPESPAQTSNAINITATIHEQKPKASNEDGDQYSLRSSIHAPPHMRSFQVQKRATPPEENASFERLSFKAVDDGAGGSGSNGLNPTKAAAEKSGEGVLKDSAKNIKLPPHLRKRFSTIGSSASSTVNDDATPGATASGPTSEAKDPAVFGTLQANARPHIDTQRLMELGTSQSAQKDNIAPLKTIASEGEKGKRTRAASTTYVPPHKRGGDDTSKMAGPVERKMAAPITESYGSEGPVMGNQAAEDTVILADSWAKFQSGSREAARTRKVILKGLPEYSTPAFAAALVWGGPLEDIVVSGNHAFVTFMHATDCENYFKATGNDIAFTKDGKTYEVIVTKDSEVTPISGPLKTAIERECTRSVRLVGVEKSFGLEDMWALAAAKNRRVESVVDGETASKARQVVVNFCSVHDAIKFKSDLRRDDDWEPVNTMFKTDPCAEANGVRTLNPSETCLVKHPLARAF